jgi:hypothetical protein
VTARFRGGEAAAPASMSTSMEASSMEASSMDTSMEASSAMEAEAAEE